MKKEKDESNRIPVPLPKKPLVGIASALLVASSLIIWGINQNMVVLWGSGMFVAFSAVLVLCALLKARAFVTRMVNHEPDSYEYDEKEDRIYECYRPGYVWDDSVYYIG